MSGTTLLGMGVIAAITFMGSETTVAVRSAIPAEAGAQITHYDDRVRRVDADGIPAFLRPTAPGWRVFLRAGYVADGGLQITFDDDAFDDLAGLGQTGLEVDETGDVQLNVGVSRSLRRFEDANLRYELEGTLLGTADIEVTEVATGVGTVIDTDPAFILFNNARLDYPLTSRIGPYLSGGIGAAFGGDNPDDIAFAYQGRVGLEFKLSDTFRLETGYRYVGASSGNYELDQHAVEMGVSLSF